jgi:MFS family permease
MAVMGARWAVAGVFAIHGAVMGSFAARIPWLKDQLDLRPSALGLALLMPAIGALLSMPFAGRLVHRFGGRETTRWLIALWCASVGLPALAPGLGWLCAAMFVYGATAGISDIAMNAQAVSIEQRLGRSIMSGLHGMWSVGGLLGSGVGALAAYADLDARMHLGLTALVLLLLGLACCQPLLDTRATDTAEAPPRLALPSGPALAIGLVMFCAIFAEISSADWCAVYVATVIGADAGTAAATFTIFSLTMAVSRLAGDLVVARLGPVRTVRIGGIVATLGGAGVVVAESPVVAIAAFGLIGLGIAVIVPLAFSAAGHSGPHPGHAIAGVATVAYGAGLAAPSTVGGIADLTSLRVSFGVVTALIAVIALAARVLRYDVTGSLSASGVEVSAESIERRDTETTSREGTDESGSGS